MIRGLAPILGLLVALASALAPTSAHAQTNLDQGKSASQIFASVCSECHKAPHGLAKGKGIGAVTDFLGEHYTTSREQAAALAAYVVGGRGGNEPIGAVQGRGRKPAEERASAAAEEPKPPKHQAKQSPKAKEGKPANAKPANAKLRRPAPEQAEPKDDASRGDRPNTAGPEGARREHRAATAAANRRREPKAPMPPQEPAAVAHAPAADVAAPAPAETTPSQEASSPGPPTAPSAAAPTDAASGDSGENAPVPRDHIPD